MLRLLQKNPQLQSATKNELQQIANAKALVRCLGGADTEMALAAPSVRNVKKANIHSAMVLFTLPVNVRMAK